MSANATQGGEKDETVAKSLEPARNGHVPS